MSEKIRSTMAWIREKAAQDTYYQSEHMVRYLTQGLFSLAQIKTCLVSGKILETHSHPLRKDAWLILGHTEEGPVHIACTKDDDNNLIVLYAYRPQLPTWEDERTRTKRNDQSMEAAVKKCFFCNSDIEPVTVGNFDFRWEGDLYVIKKVPAGLCVQCGEKYVTAKVSEKIVKKIAQEQSVTRDSVLVFEYENS